MPSNRWVRLAASGVAVFLFTALSADAGPILTDPPGDTFGTGTHDITTYSAITDPATSTTLLTVNFAGPISPPSAFAPDSVLGFIDLDTDRNPTTGGTTPWLGALTGGNSWINFFIPPNPGTPALPPPHDTLIALGDEFYVDLFSEASNPGFVDLTDANTGAVAAIPIAFGPTSFSILIPLTGSGNGSLNFGLLFGTIVGPTDRAPNGAEPAQSYVPEPGSIVSYAIMLLCLLGYAWRRGPHWQRIRPTRVA